MNALIEFFSIQLTQLALASTILLLMLFWMSYLLHRLQNKLQHEKAKTYFALSIAMHSDFAKTNHLERHIEIYHPHYADPLFFVDTEDMNDVTFNQAATEQPIIAEAQPSS